MALAAIHCFGAAILVARAILGCGWAVSLVMIGLWIGQAAAVFAVAAGLLVFMAMVADPLAPRASPAVTGCLKLVTGATWWLALLGGIFMAWQRLAAHL
jgi:uncharacterized membrane protein